MFYYLPNHRPIDTEGAIDGMLDSNTGNRYFLDLETGNVGCIATAETSADKKLVAVLQETHRYKELPQIPVELKARWLGTFIDDIVAPDDPSAAVQLLEALREKGFDAARTLLESLPGDWIVGWHPIEGDATFDLLGEWLAERVPNATYEWKGCGECAVCRAAGDGTSIEELRDAFEEQRQHDDYEDPPQK